MRSEMKKSSKASGLKSEDKCLGLWFNYQKKRERDGKMQHNQLLRMHWNS